MTIPVTAEQVLPPATGAAATNTANIKAAIAAVTKAGGKVLARAGTYVVNQAIVVPSGVWVEGMGEGSTVFTPATGFVGPVFEVSKGSGSRLDTVYEFAGQGFLNGLRNLSVWGNTIPQAMAINAGPIPDSRQSADGIWVHDVDHTRLENVSVNWLAGYGLKVGGVVRESSFANVQMFRCGTMSGKPCLWLANSTAGDQNNTLQFDNLRIVYPHGPAVMNDESGDPVARGTRLLHFIGGQIEAGGYGGTPGTMQTSGAAFPADLVYLGNCKDVYFTELELSTSGGNKLINAISVQSLIVNKCLLADAGNGPGIYMGNAEFLSVSECFGYTVGGKMVTISAITGRAEVPASNHFIDVATGGDAQYDSSANPSTFHGPSSGGGGALPAVEAPRFIGAPGQPAFSSGISNIGWGWRETLFWKDLSGAVHIEGGVFVGAPLAQGAALFVLPPGYRPTGIVGGPAQAVYVDATGAVRNNSGPLAANSYLVFAGGWVFRP